MILLNNLTGIKWSLFFRFADGWTPEVFFDVFMFCLLVNAFVQLVGSLVRFDR